MTDWTFIRPPEPPVSTSADSVLLSTREGLVLVHKEWPYKESVWRCSGQHWEHLCEHDPGIQSFFAYYDLHEERVFVGNPEAARVDTKMCAQLQ